MALCSICSSIPLDNDGLPPLPDELTGSRPQRRYLYPIYHWGTNVKLTKFPFHPNLASLKSSAKACDLCRLVLDAIEKAIDEMETPSERLHGDSVTQKPTWELWLTKRRGLGDGFYVYTNFEDTHDFGFVAAVGFCVKEGDPLASLYAGRPLEDRPDSPATMARAMNWVRQCNEHQTCTAELPRLPFRVLDVGDEVNGNVLKLSETTHETGRYVCLSHCWGQVSLYTTTRATLEAHKIKIIEEKLPKSFRDAIQVTRYLGIRYIWIDSLCICQDDGEDWERESAKMTDVYMNSYLTIAASAAKDSSFGCFITRKPTKYVKIPRTTKSGISGELEAFLLPVRKESMHDLYVEMHDHLDKPDHPLSTRAWAVQERILPRRTLHYGKHQMYFECNQGFRGENGLHIPWRYFSIHSDAPKERVREGPRSEQEIALALWNDLLWDYGVRSLTKPSDKLPAISGVARLLAKRIDDEYIAGLWRKTLIEGLLWDGLGVHRVPEYRAPSWSWASVDGTPAVSDYNHEHLAEILGYEVKLKGKNNFGEVESGWIKIRAPLVPVFLDENAKVEAVGSLRENIPNIRTKEGNTENLYFDFDFDFTGSKGEKESLSIVESLKVGRTFLLILAKNLPDDDDQEVRYQSLIVGITNGEAMQRLGKATCYSEHLGECSQLDHPEERPVVMLV